MEYCVFILIEWESNAKVMLMYYNPNLFVGLQIFSITSIIMVI